METLEKVKETLEYHRQGVRKYHAEYQILLKETRKKEIIELIQNKYFQIGVNNYHIKSIENIYDSDYMECIADVQMPWTGNYRVWTDGGFQTQWFGTVRSYAKTSQIEFSDLEKSDKDYVAIGENPAAKTTFNDRGNGYIVGSFRVVLPTDEKNMMAIQKDFGSEKSLIDNLVRPTLYKVITACGPLMSSLESVSETRTDLTAYITDQLNNGVYKTKTSKVEILNEITGEKEIRTQSELIPDKNAPGGWKRQETSPFSQYGITAGIVSIIDIKYDDATQQQINAQKSS